MRCLLIVAAVCLIAAPASAGSRILPIHGTGYLNYNAATGEITPATPATRNIGPVIWHATQESGYFYGHEEFVECSLDWGDIGTVGVPVEIGGLGWSEFTNSQAADGDLQMVIMVYCDENGFNTAGRVALAGYVIDNIPGSTHPPNEFWGYLWRLEALDPIIIDGDDLDADGMQDFGYVHWFEVIPSEDAIAGPAIAGDPNANPPTAPGIENAFDMFNDPDLYNDGNLATAEYWGTYWFGGTPFAQFFWEMFLPGCPNRGCSGRYCQADIDGSFDCLVNLADLAQLLSNYGTSTGMTLLNGDVDPYDPFFPGDGDVDLGDLAELLSQYGDDCNWPLPTGACCMPSGACWQLSEPNCRCLGGVFQGVATTCTARAACCLDDGSCIMVDPLCCDEQGGQTQGPGTMCTIEEACCLPGGDCIMLDPLCCDDEGGVPWGPGTTCDPNPCPP
jgi:hypothetical protein